MTEEGSRIVELFQAALDVDARSRRAWLAAECENDAELREVEELLNSHEGFSLDLDSSAAALRGLADELWREPLPIGTSIGKYRLLSVLASGGMGIVYLAEQSSPQRQVALKVLSTGLNAGSAKQRFDYESQILAHLRHPGIAQVYDCGTVDIRERLIPWFAMELVEGAQSLTGYANEKGLSVVSRLALIVEVCAAVHFGHQKGVVHRDLKPDNILVDQHGCAKVIDFGVAKATDADLGLMTLQTQTDQLLGTMSYMSPEQALGDSRAIDTRSDVYSLGVILFELLTGKLPHDFSGLSIIASVRELTERDVDFGPLERTGLASDLRVIVRKALASERVERYDSAMALADDIGRFCRSEPIAARAPSAQYLMRRFARRNRLLVAAVATVVVIFLLGTIGTTVGFLRATEARERAEQATTEALWGRDFLAQMLYEADPWHGRGPSVTLGDAVRQASARLLREPPQPGPSSAGEVPSAGPQMQFPGANVEAEIRAIFGEVHLRLGDHAEALVHFRRAIEIRRSEASSNEAHALQLSLGVVQVLTRQGELESAEREAHDLVAAHEGFYGESHPRNLRAMDVLAQVYVAGHRYQDAIRIYRSALLVVSTQTKDEEKFIATLKNNLAQALHGSGDFEESEILFRDVLDWRTENLGGQHPATLTALNNLAGVLFEQGKVAKSVPFFERVLEAQELLLGGNHVGTLTTVNNLATAMRSLGELERAEQLSRRAWEGRSSGLGPDHSNTLVSMSNLAVALMGRGVKSLRAGEVAQSKLWFDESESLFRDCLKRRRAIEPRASGLRAKLHSSFGNLMLCRGENKIALEQYSEALLIADELWGKDRWETWMFRAGRGRAALGMGRFAEARDLLETSLKELTRLRPEHASTQTVRLWLKQLEVAERR